MGQLNDLARLEVRLAPPLSLSALPGSPWPVFTPTDHGSGEGGDDLELRGWLDGELLPTSGDRRLCCVMRWSKYEVAEGSLAGSMG